MNTKVIIVGENGEKPKKLNPIVFRTLVEKSDESPHCNARLYSGRTLPFAYEYKYIELICRNYFPNVDIMYAYNDPAQRHIGTLFLANSTMES